MTVLTHQEAAAFLKVNQATLRKLRRRGDIRGALVGSQYRYLPADLEAFLRRPLGSSESGALHVSQAEGSPAPPAIDQPRRAVHHRAFYSLNRGVRS